MKVYCLWGFCLLIMLLQSVTPANAQSSFEPATITFDGSPYQERGTSTIYGFYYEHDFLFEPYGNSDGIGRHGGGQSTSPDNGTAYLKAAVGLAATFQSRYGEPFNLLSLDLAEYSTLFAEPYTLPVVGHRPDGSVVRAWVTTDGIIDGTGPIQDFETFTFGPEFSNLTRVDFPAFGWSIDNVVVMIVPEQGTVCVGMMGYLIFLGWRRWENGRR